MSFPLDISPGTEVTSYGGRSPGKLAMSFYFWDQMLPVPELASWTAGRP